MPTIKTSFRWCIIHMIGIIDRVVFFGIIGISHKRRAIRLFPCHAIFRPCKTPGAAKIILCSRTTDGRKEYNQPDRKMPVLLPLFFFTITDFTKILYPDNKKTRSFCSWLSSHIPSKPHTEIHFFHPNLSTQTAFFWKFCSLRSQNNQRTRLCLRLRLANCQVLLAWLSLRPISISQLHTLLCFHL